MYNILFNFSSSYSGGGLKRLEEFSKWFSENGGATFLINEKSKSITDKYPNNKYFTPKISKLSRLLNQEHYFENLKLNKTKIDLYYSYGIPLTKKIAAKNLLHISNVLPFMEGNFGYNRIEKIKFLLLRYYFYRSFKYAYILSAESEFSISLFEKTFKKLKVVSKNGSDEEIEMFLHRKNNNNYENYAIVLGTHKHKCIGDSYKLFNELYKKNNLLKLKIIGDTTNIPKFIVEDKNVELLGVLNREEVLKLLSSAKVYISTTLVENSYNAASEAIFLAEKSYISEIKPHYELLDNLNFERRYFENINLNIIEVHSKNIDIRNLVKWEQVIKEIINFI